MPEVLRREEVAMILMKAEYVRPTSVVAEMVTDDGTEYLIRDDFAVFRISRQRMSGDPAWTRVFQRMTTARSFDAAVTWINDKERELAAND